MNLEPRPEREEIRNLDDLRCYTGIADSAGLESFIPWGEVTQGTLNFMTMRCTYASERKGVMYRVFVRQADADVIEQFLNERKFKHALYYMKLHALETQLARGAGEAAWASIPEMTMVEAEEIKKMEPAVKLDPLKPTNQLDLL